MMANTQGVRDDKLRELIEIAEAAGWRTERGGGTHVKFFTPEDKYVTSCSTTSVGSRTYYIVRGKLRRAGLQC
jgi:predicted RNA binding protein YcfA (HicA-like mRNA interferase family)